METLAHTPEKTNNATVMFKQEGIMDVSWVDNTGNTPLFEARVKNDRPTSPSAYVQPERGVYGLEVPGEKFADESYKYTSHNATQNRDKLKRTARNAEHSPLVTFAKDGIAYYAGIDSPYSIVVLTGEPGEAAIATQLKGDGEARTGVYAPNAGDRIYIVETALADHMTQNPADANKIHDEILLADASSFAYLEVSDEFALNMAYNAKSAGKSNAEKLAKKRAAQANPANRATTTPDAATDDESTPSATSSDNSEQQASDTPENEGPYNVYDPEARVGSELPDIDTVLIDNEPTSAAKAAGQTEPAPQIFPINEPLATSAPSASSQARERMRQSKDDDQDTPAAPRFVETDHYTQARDAYAAANQELARGVAARTKLGMFARRKTREASDQEIAAQQAAYERTAEVFDTIQVEKWISNGIVDAWKAKDPSLTDDQINERMAQKLANYHTAKQRLHNLHAEHEFRQQKGKFGKLSEWNDRASEWYAGLGKKEKIAASIGATVVGGALGVVAAPLGVIGGAGIVAAKVWKTSMQTRSGLYEGPKQVDALKATDGGRLKTTDEMRREFSERMTQARTGKIENADRINRRARYATLASAAFLGAGILSHVDVVRDAYQGATEQLGDWLNGGGRPGVGVETGTGAGAVDGAPNGASEVGSGSNAPTAEAPVAPAPAPNPEYQFSSAARTVVAGEGFYNTFAEMGITNPAEQASLLQKVGPELVARGIAYPMADGTYGISRPGALSQDVLELIQKNR